MWYCCQLCCSNTVNKPETKVVWSDSGQRMRLKEYRILDAEGYTDLLQPVLGIRNCSDHTELKER
jgi:hypothetical protein